MVKKRMAMRMVTIFVALIVCGMFFPGLARGEDQNLDAVLTEGGNTLLTVELGDVVLGDLKTTSVGITNQSPTSIYYVTLLLNPGATCTSEFTYNGPSSVANFQPGDSLDVEVTYTPSAPGACNAALQITYYGSEGGLVEINFNGNGIEEVTQTFEPIVIGSTTTSVIDRPVEIGENETSTLQEMIDHCDNKDGLKNHGKLVRCIARVTGELCRAGDITGGEKGKLVRAAAREKMQRVIKKWKERKRSKRGSIPWWWLLSRR
ncbi:MAG: hypothetical protein PVJ69_09400 [Desulfobacteraceae bacterium]|jgi:hypothetical protein